MLPAGVGLEEAPIEGLASVRRSNGTCSFPAFAFMNGCARCAPGVGRRPRRCTSMAGLLPGRVCAPSGGNMQRWRFVVIRDPKIKEAVGALYKRAWDEQVAPRYRSGQPAPCSKRSAKRPLMRQRG